MNCTCLDSHDLFVIVIWFPKVTPIRVNNDIPSISAQAYADNASLKKAYKNINNSIFLFTMKRDLRKKISREIK